MSEPGRAQRGSLDVRRLDAAREEDFLHLHSDACGAGWCRCVAWWVDTWEAWGERTAEENYALRVELFGRGEHDGYLGYLGAEPVAWCQVGRRDRLAKLVRQLALVPDPEVWAVTCFLVAPRWRGCGLAGDLLAGVLADLDRRGVCRVEAYPKVDAGHDPLEQWAGPSELFRAAGFREVRPASQESSRAVWLRG